jgi:uncharacterized protein DUF4062
MERSKVFISSAIGGDVDAERAAVIEVVDSNPYLRAWDFSREPAAPGPLQDSYLRHVDDCALFMAVIGAEIRDAVENELHRAQETGREVLIFRKRVVEPSSRLKAFLGDADVKYASFESLDELRYQVREALDDFIAHLLTQRSRPAGPPNPILRQLRSWARGKESVQVGPAIPRGREHDVLIVEEANVETVQLHKNSGETIWIAISQISSVRAKTPSAPGKILLRGRLQWMSVRARWAGLDEPPTTEYGVPKSAGAADPRITDIQRLCAERGYSVSFASETHLPNLLARGYDIFYDEDGRYFVQGGSILVVNGIMR